MKGEKTRLFQICPRILFVYAAFFSLFWLTACASTLKKAEKMLTPSVQSEKEMGQKFAEEAAKQLKLVTNPEVVEYIAQIGQPIVEAAQPMSYRFRFHVVNGPALNAFAVPGGHVYLYSGLLLKARSVHEVAAVIAHELSHVKHRHTAQMIGKGTLVSLATLATILVARGQQAAAVGAIGAGQALQLSFSREFELEADRFGLFYLHQARYNPYGLLDFFSTMMREQTFSTSRIPPYLLTHPVTPERMAQIDHLIHQHRLEVQNPKEMPDFYRFQGILQAEVGDATQVVPLLKQQVEADQDDPHLWHRLGLAYDRYGWTQEALSALGKALTVEPKLASAWADLGTLQARMGRWSKAEASFNSAIRLAPGYARAYVGWGEMLLKLDEPREAQRLFRKAISLEPNLIKVHSLLARALKATKDEGAFHLEMATFYEKMDRSREAVEHLEKALKEYGEDSKQGEDVKRRIKVIRSS